MNPIFRLITKYNCSSGLIVILIITVFSVFHQANAESGFTSALRNFGLLPRDARCKLYIQK
jgi:hypothetical protein